MNATPKPHPNFILGSLQLIAWALYRPTAWRMYVAAQELPRVPFFNLNLVELPWRCWSHPLIWRTLVMTLLICPFLAAGQVALLLWLLGSSGTVILTAVLIALANSIAGSIVAFILLGPILGMLSSLQSGVVVGLIYGLAYTYGWSVPLGVLIGLLLGMTYGSAILLIPDQNIATPARHVGGIIVGVLSGLLISALVLVGMRAATVGLINILPLTLVFTLIISLTSHWRRGLLLGLLLGGIVGVTDNLVVMAARGLMGNLMFQEAYSVVFLAFGVLTLALVTRLAGPAAGAVAGAMGCGGSWLTIVVLGNRYPVWPVLPLGFLGIGVGLALTWWRPPLLYALEQAWNTLLYYADLRQPAGKPLRLRWHAAFWDERQPRPFTGLEAHLLLAIERDPDAGREAVGVLSTTPQRWAVQAVQIELAARTLEQCRDVQAIAAAHQRLSASELPGPASSLLRSFRHHSQDIAFALNQSGSYHQRLALGASAEQITNLINSLTRSSEPYAGRFYPIAVQWQQVVHTSFDALARAIELSQEIDNPYIFGVPLTSHQQIFVGRTDIAIRIEQLLLDPRRPPLLLYGQRRMGKTSLLRNLGRLLPNTIVPLFVDGEGIAGVRDYSAFLYALARALTHSANQQRNLTLPPLSRASLADDPFTVFLEWLDQVEAALIERDDSIALLMFDEIEAIDSVLDRGRFDETDLLRMLRHLIQHRPRFKVLLSGSHGPDELRRWAGYLINMQAVKIGYLAEDAARQLIEQPVEHFSLRYEPAAVAAVLTLTRGHPHLVQLLCYEIVTLKNAQPPTQRRLATVADVAAAVPEALRSGSLFFADIEHNQVDPAGAALLRLLAARGTGAVVSRAQLAHAGISLDSALDCLLRRDLIESVGDGYRFQVELIRRWFDPDTAEASTISHRF